MEPEIIYWKNVQWRFVEDELYEHINAPKWVDFTAIHDPVDDEAWFCRPDCKHPKTAEELLRVTPSKLTCPGYSSETVRSSDRKGRNGKLKGRGHPQSSNNENQNPNFSTPQNHTAKAAFTKAEIKSSTEKRPMAEDERQKNNGAALSARNLFGGRDILNQFTEFCNEIKRMAIRVREGENNKQLAVEKCVEEVPLKDSVKERKPFGELSVEKSDGSINNSLKQKKRINIQTAADRENIPTSLDSEKVGRHEREDTALQIRTNPPSPQCFSMAPNKITPSKGTKSRLKEKEKEKEMIVELGKEKEVSKQVYSSSSSSAVVDEKEGSRALDVLWFLKPCTLSN